MSWRLKIICPPPPLAPICGEGRQEEGQVAGVEAGAEGVLGQMFSPQCFCPGLPLVWAQGTEGRAGRQLVCHHPPLPVQIPRDTWLVAEIPFISLNCITSNTAGGRFSVDLSYWGLASTKPGRKNLSCTENYCCSICYLQYRQGQRRSAPCLPGQGTRCCRGNTPASWGKPEPLRPR